MIFNSVVAHRNDSVVGDTDRYYLIIQQAQFKILFTTFNSSLRQSLQTINPLAMTMTRSSPHARLRRRSARHLHQRILLMAQLKDKNHLGRKQSWRSFKHTNCFSSRKNSQEVLGVCLLLENFVRWWSYGSVFRLRWCSHDHRGAFSSFTESLHYLLQCMDASLATTWTLKSTHDPDPFLT